MINYPDACDKLEFAVKINGFHGKKHNENVFFSFQIPFFDLIRRYLVSKNDYPARKNKIFFIFISMKTIDLSPRTS